MAQLMQRANAREARHRYDDDESGPAFASSKLVPAEDTQTKLIRWLLIATAVNLVFNMAFVITALASGYMFYRSDTNGNIVTTIQQAKDLSNPEVGIMYHATSMMKSMDYALPQAKLANITTDVAVMLAMVVSNDTDVQGTVNAARQLSEHVDSALQHVNDNKGIRIPMEFFVPMEFAGHHSSTAPPPHPPSPSPSSPSETPQDPQVTTSAAVPLEVLKAPTGIPPMVTKPAPGRTKPPPPPSTKT